MPFDETLRRSLETLARELTSTVEAERAEAAAIAHEAAQQDTAAAIANAEAAAEQRGHETGRQLGFDKGRKEGYAAGLAEGREQGIDQGRTEGREQAQAAVNAADLATSQRLADAMRAIDRARSLSEILDTLASCAGRETARVAVLLVRASQLRGWRFIGFGPALDEDVAFETALAESGIIAEAVRNATATSADSAAAGSAPSFAELPPGRELLAVPISMSGQAVAVLYGDQGTGDPGEGEVRFAWPATLEVMTRHAARCLEAVTAFRAAQVLTERPSSVGDVANSRSGDSSTPRLTNSPTSVDDEQAARRYARLLVSEIKLYHEPDVMAGRRARDLGMRLGGEIAHARVLYEQRVQAHIRSTADYFHDELVRTLADGDETLLEVRS